MAGEHFWERVVDRVVEKVEHDVEVLWQAMLTDGRPMFWLDRRKVEAEILKRHGPDGLAAWWQAVAAQQPPPGQV